MVSLQECHIEVRTCRMSLARPGWTRAFSLANHVDSYQSTPPRSLKDDVAPYCRFANRNPFGTV